MKSILKIIFCLAFPFMLKAQPNLVPNWSFEDLTDCNFNSNGDLPKASPWFAAVSQGSSTELFNLCDTTFYGVPVNFKGYQEAKSGYSYAGFIPWDGGGTGWYYREYVEVMLLNSLIPGKVYCVSFYLNPSNYHSCYTSSIGAVLTYDSLLSVIPPVGHILIDTMPDILNSNIISDTINWTKISGTYNCSVGKRYLTIGNFHDDHHTTFSSTPNGMYYYLDDVSVVEVSPADAGNDTAVCVGANFTIGGQPTFDAEYTWYELADSANSSSIDSVHIARPHVSPGQSTSYVMWKRQCNAVTRDTVNVSVNCNGIKEQTTISSMQLYPNPAGGSIHISYRGDASAIQICNLLGQVQKRIEPVNSEMEISLEELPAGVYFVTEVKKYAITKGVKLIKQ